MCVVVACFPVRKSEKCTRYNRDKRKDKFVIVSCRLGKYLPIHFPTYLKSKTIKINAHLKTGLFLEFESYAMISQDSHQSPKTITLAPNIHTW